MGGMNRNKRIKKDIKFIKLGLLWLNMRKCQDLNV